MAKSKTTAAGDPASRALAKLSKSAEPLVKAWAAALLAHSDRDDRRTAKPRRTRAAAK
jgi:hypothetical protein